MAMEQLDHVDFSCIKKKIQDIQEADLKERRQKRRLEASAEASKSTELHILLCKVCRGEICLSEEIKVCDNERYVPINSGFYNAVQIKRIEESKHKNIGNGVSKVAKISCNGTSGDGICNNHLGGVQSIKNRMIPTLRANSLIIQDPKGDVQTYKT